MMGSLCSIDLAQRSIAAKLRAASRIASADTTNSNTEPPRDASPAFLYLLPTMKFQTIALFARLGLGFLLIAACGDDPAGLGTQCLMDSECDGALVCRFGYCRPRCANDKDCADLPGSRCAAAQGEGVCLLPELEDCVRGQSCPSMLVCVDLACRATCETATDCPSEQACTDGYCRQPCTETDDCVSADECVSGICQPRVLDRNDAGVADDAGPEMPRDASSDTTAAPPCVAAPEICNGLDDDCDGDIDENTDAAGFADRDGDGHGDPNAPIRDCATAAALSLLADDCDDSRVDVHGGQPEVCDEIDNDCDSRVDEGAAPTTWYRDADGDGFGFAANGMTTSCEPPTGFSLLDRDCDDADATISPAAEEQCDGRDNDCNGRADFRVALDYEDTDQDGHADAACGGDDCDDNDPSVHPGATELMDGLDNDCDDSTGDQCEAISWFADEDGDGFGTSVAMSSCEPIPGFVIQGGDCNDESVSIYPGAIELCDGADNDCDETIDDFASIACRSAHAATFCREGLCAIAQCEEGWENCDGSAASGCEVQIDADPQACGDCGTVCPSANNARPLCVRGSCDLMCEPGFGDCNGRADDGCELDVRSNIRNCGACGRACDMSANQTAQCLGGECVSECTGGYADCDGDVGNGCEVQTNRDLQHCGMCNRACPSADDICAAGACVRAPFDCTGATEAFEPNGSEPIVELAPGVHRFTSVHIPPTVTVMTRGNATLEICSVGDVVIEGAIDLSGGEGGVPQTATARGGDTGNPSPTLAGGTLGQCHPGGGGGSGAAGSNAAILATCTAGPAPNHGLGGAFGGGAGGLGRTHPGAGGGGGYAGGGGGSGVNVHLGGAGASFMSDVGGAAGGDMRRRVRRSRSRGVRGRHRREHRRLRATRRRGWWWSHWRHGSQRSCRHVDVSTGLRRRRRGRRWRARRPLGNRRRRWWWCPANFELHPDRCHLGRGDSGQRRRWWQRPSRDRWWRWFRRRDLPRGARN